MPCGSMKSWCRVAVRCSWYNCSAQFRNLRNLEIALRILGIPKLRANLEIAQQHCAISRLRSDKIAQSRDCAVARLRNLEIPD